MHSSEPADSGTPKRTTLELPTVLFRLDHRGVCLWISGPFLGKSQTEITGLPLDSFLLHASREALRKALRFTPLVGVRRVEIRDPVTRRRFALLLTLSGAADDQVHVFGAAQLIEGKPKSLRKQRPDQDATTGRGDQRTDQSLETEQSPDLGQVEKRRSVLVADDQEMLTRLLQRVLEQAGFDVYATHDGTACLATLREQADRIGFVVLDLSMPGPTSAEVFAALRSGLHPPVVLVTTGHSREHVREILETDEGWLYLQKPYSNDQLIEVIERELDPGRTTDR